MLRTGLRVSEVVAMEFDNVVDLGRSHGGIPALEAGNVTSPRLHRMTLDEPVTRRV